MKFEKKIKAKVLRTFSESFKKEQVKLVEQGKVSVSEIAKAYRVSTTAVYKWVKKYSSHYPCHVKQVVEMESEAVKTIALEKKKQELERIIGEKQVQIEYLEKLIELASKDLGIDIKKAIAGKLSNK